MPTLQVKPDQSDAEEGWLGGQVNGNEGWFPAAYAEEDKSWTPVSNQQSTKTSGGEFKAWGDEQGKEFKNGFNRCYPFMMFSVIQPLFTGNVAVIWYLVIISHSLVT